MFVLDCLRRRERYWGFWQQRKNNNVSESKLIEEVPTPKIPEGENRVSIDSLFDILDYGDAFYKDLDHGLYIGQPLGGISITGNLCSKYSADLKIQFEIWDETDTIVSITVYS